MEINLILCLIAAIIVFSAFWAVMEVDDNK